MQVNLTLITFFTFLILALLGRILTRPYSSKNSVDQYYWLIIANAFKKQKTLPITIDNFLLEENAQAYPPFFGFLIGRIIPRKFQKQLMEFIEFLEVVLLGTFLWLIGVDTFNIALSMCFFLSAPILITYNSQLTPRIFGDLFLLIVLITQVLAHDYAGSWILIAFFLVVSALFTALLIATHKMAFQLYLFMIPIWCLLVTGWHVLLTLLVGAILFILIVGKSFAVYQMKAHLDILQFWYKNCEKLGAHQFQNSPLYGSANMDGRNVLHLEGFKGYLKYFRLIISYSPIGILFPICSFIEKSWPPDWVMGWFFLIYLLTILTLFIPKLRFLGGGHLYLFFVIPPSAIYLSFIPLTSQTLLILLIGSGLLGFSLFKAYELAKSRNIEKESGFNEMVEFLSSLETKNVAVFPLQSADELAFKTEHKILWGGHGSGFKKLEGFFPILTIPLKEVFDSYKINVVAWNGDYWGNGEKVLTREKLIKKNSVVKFDKWYLAFVSS